MCIRDRPKGINEFFLDMNGMRSINRSIKDTGLSIINRIEDQIGISGVVGISTNKLVSSIVTSVISDSIYEVEKGKESQFLSPLSPLLLPVAKENYVHRILKFLWIDHIGQIQSIAKEPDHFQIFFGKYASMLDKQSKGDDSSFVKPIEHKDHILEQIVLKRDTNDQVILHSVLRDLSDKIAFSLRQRKKLAKKVRLDIHYVDGYKTQSMGSFNAVDDLSVMNMCKLLFNRANQRRNRIRSILIDAWNFHPYSFQQNLFSKGIDRTISLSKAVDKIRLKYGMHMLRNASVLNSAENHKCLST